MSIQFQNLKLESKMFDTFSIYGRPANKWQTNQAIKDRFINFLTKF